MKAIAAGVGFLLLVFLVPGNTADADSGYRARHCASNFWGCRGHYRRRARRHRYHPHRAAGRLHRGLKCHSRRRVVGDERTTKGRALKAAERAWMGAIRYDHGERYQDLDNAKDVLRNCDPSSVRDQSVRCVIEATPCLAPRGSTSVRLKGRYNDDDDEKGGS